MNKKTIFDKMTEFDCCALLLNGEMILGTTSGGGNQFLYASIDASDDEYWNSVISDEEAVRVYSEATTIEPIE